MKKTMDVDGYWNMDDGQWKMDNELSLPMSELIFLVCFSKLSNCYISAKHIKPCGSW